MVDAPSRPSYPKYVLTLLSQVILPIVLLWLSGDWGWIAGWIFGFWLSGFCIACIRYLYVHDPALLAERSRRPGTGGEPVWDQVAIVAIGVVFLAWFVIMPLDARRFHWSPDFPLGLKLMGLALLILGSTFMYRALVENTFASSMVRLQPERRQRVITSGVYRVVRHPMYMGAIAMMLGGPLLLSSRWGLAIAALMIVVLALRTLGEDRMLADRLEGYEAYRKQVRYRLIPWVW